MTVPARLSFLMMSSSAARTWSTSRGLRSRKCRAACALVSTAVSG